MTITRRIGFGVGAAVVALTVSAGVYASAQNTNPNPHPFMGRGGPGGPGGRGGPMGPDGPLGMLRMLGPRLNLTDAQKEQVKNIAESRRDEWKALGDRARTAHEALHGAITADSVDEALIRQRSAEVAAVEADLAVAQARTHAEVFQILTAEQKEQVKAFQADAKNRMEQRRQGGRGRGF
jgi:protein CpxP